MLHNILVKYSSKSFAVSDSNWLSNGDSTLGFIVTLKCSIRNIFKFIVFVCSKPN